MDLIRIITVARRRWMSVVACILVALVVAGAVTFTREPVYEARTRLFLTTPGATPSDVYQAATFAERRVQSYADVVESDRVARGVADRLDLDASDLSARISGEADTDTVILSIAATDEDPGGARDIADAAASVMRDEVQDLDGTLTRKQAVELTVIDAAETPTEPQSPVPARDLGLAALLGLVVGICWALLREALSRRDDSTATEPARSPQRSSS